MSEDESQTPETLEEPEAELEPVDDGGRELSAQVSDEELDSPEPAQKSKIAAGLGIGAVVTLVLSCCCSPMVFLSAILGLAGAIMGFQVNRAVAAGDLHAVNKKYGRFGIIGGAIVMLGGIALMIFMFLGLAASVAIPLGLE